MDNCCDFYIFLNVFFLANTHSYAADSYVADKNSKSRKVMQNSINSRKGFHLKTKAALRFDSDIIQFM